MAKSQSLVMAGRNCDDGRDATIPFFQNRSDPENSEDRPIPIQSDTSAGFFYFIIVEFLYFSVLTWSSLFCVLNTIYYSVSQLVGQKCWVCSPKVGREAVLSGSWIEYSQRHDINKKRNSKCFSDARLLFKNSCMKAMDTSVRCSLRKERVLEKNTLSRSAWGQMRCWPV